MDSTTPPLLVDSKSYQHRTGTSERNPPTTCQGSPRKEGSAATVTATLAWQPAEGQASCSLPADLSNGGELSVMPRDSPESFPCYSFSTRGILFITIPSLSPGKTKCYREGY